MNTWEGEAEEVRSLNCESEVISRRVSVAMVAGGSMFEIVD